VIVTDPSSHIPPFGTWFSHRWAQLHPDAHTSNTLDQAVIDRMFTGEYSSTPGSLDHVLEHCEQYPLQDIQNVDFFIARFRRAFNTIVREGTPEMVVNWQDPLFFAELQNEYADQLHKVGMYQTCHVHTVLPNSLHRSPWGQIMLESLSRMDRIFVHTEGYRTALERQLAEFSNRHPRIDRFDLMLDLPLLRSISDDDTDIHTLPDFLALDDTQKTAVTELLRTSEGADAVPHRFLCLDRADPGKGVTVLLKAIEDFLDEQRTQGCSMDELRRLYRFFSFHDQLPASGKSFDSANIKEQYAHVVAERYAALQQKYPGIVYCCKSISKTIAVRLMDNCHALTACTQDGLNLAWPETVWVNAYHGRNRFGVMAQGAGFAQEALRRGVIANPEYFPPAGSVEGFKQGIATLVRKSNEVPNSLGNTARMLAADYIDKRRDSVIIDA
jgi:hypothetical protein